MRRYLLVACLLGVFGLISVAQESLTPDDPLNSEPVRVIEKFLDVEREDVDSFIGWVETEFIVVFSPEAARELGARTNPVNGRPVVSDASIQGMLEEFEMVRFERQFKTARPQAFDSSYPDLTGHYSVQVSRASDRDLAMSVLESHPDVERTELIGMHTTSATPNDTYFQNPPPSFPNEQWHLWNSDSIDADLAWDLQTGSSDVLVGILDSGTRYFHIDLGGNSAQWGPGNPFAGGNIFINSGETPGNGVDDDGNGFTDDTIGWDFVTSAGGGGVSCIDQDCSGADNDPDDANGHGTHTAGTVGAITNNNRQVAGVAGGFSDGTVSGAGNGVKIVPLRIGYHARYRGATTGVVRMDWAAQAMNYLADLVDAGHNVASINCSWGSSNSGGLNAAVDNLQAHDVLIVHAAGNSGSSSSDYLGSKAGVMSVAATDINGNGASFSNYGSWVEVAAPGVDVLSTYRSPDDPDPTAHYIALLDGTSMSAPHVAGIAALLESCDASLTRQQKFDLIVNNTDPYNSSRDLGAGIANARKALDAAGTCGGTPCDIAADFSASSTSGCASLTVNFSDLSTGTGINGWSWDFGDTSGSTAQNPSHTYTSAGTYTVSLTASNNDCSASETKTAYITVSDSPTADFNGSPTSGTVPLTVSFTDLSGGNPTSWTWNFGDTGGSSAQNPSHTYTAIGTYSVTLTASNACGTDAITRTAYITVTEQVEATTMHVSAIAVGTQNQGGGNKLGIASVTIEDDQGGLVAGATVTGTFSGAFNGTQNATTNASGVASFSIGPKKGNTTFTFCVDNVSHGTLTYASGDNVLTCNTN